MLVQGKKSMTVLKKPHDFMENSIGIKINSSRAFFVDQASFLEILVAQDKIKWPLISTSLTGKNT